MTGQIRSQQFVKRQSSVSDGVPAAAQEDVSQRLRLLRDGASRRSAQYSQPKAPGLQRGAVAEVGGLSLCD